MMEYGKICPLCGAHLDPGEKCDCTEDLDRVRLPWEDDPLMREDGDDD